MTRSKEVQDFIDANPDKFKVVSPEETAKTLEKQSGGYFKGKANHHEEFNYCCISYY
jgi:hypothetical protein